MKILKKAKLSHKDFTECNKKIVSRSGSSCVKERDLDCGKQSRTVNC